MTPNQLKEALRLTALKFTNLKAIVDKDLAFTFAGMRLEDGDHYVYAGLVSEPKLTFASMTRHDKLEDADRALRAIQPKTIALAAYFEGTG